MITLTMDATLFLGCDEETGEVVQLTIQPSAVELVAYRGDEEEHDRAAVARAVLAAAYNYWPVIRDLPSSIIWEGDMPWSTPT